MEAEQVDIECMASSRERMSAIRKLVQREQKCREKVDEIVKQIEIMKTTRVNVTRVLNQNISHLYKCKAAAEERLNIAKGNTLQHIQGNVSSEN